MFLVARDRLVVVDELLLPVVVFHCLVGDLSLASTGTIGANLGTGKPGTITPRSLGCDLLSSLIKQILENQILNVTSFVELVDAMCCQMTRVWLVLIRCCNVTK